MALTNFTSFRSFSTTTKLMSEAIIPELTLHYKCIS